MNFHLVHEDFVADVAVEGLMPSVVGTCDECWRNQRSPHYNITLYQTMQGDFKCKKCFHHHLLTWFVRAINIAKVRCELITTIVHSEDQISSKLTDNYQQVSKELVNSNYPFVASIFRAALAQQVNKLKKSRVATEEFVRQLAITKEPTTSRNIIRRRK